MPVLGAALLIGLLPAQSFALPPDPATIETGRETLETTEPLELETLPEEKPLEGETFEKDLESLKVDVPANLEQAPAGTATPPPAETGAITFGSATSPASFTTTTTQTATVTDGDLTQVPNLPVKLGQAAGQPMPTGTWQATVVDRAGEISKGVEGVTKVGALVTVQAPATGSVPISVGLDYGTFQNVYGADWSSRLRLVQFPECYLTTPLEEACQAFEELETVNDTATHSITATVDTAADGTVAPASATGGTTTSGSGVMQAAYTTPTDKASTATPAAAGDKAVIGAVDSGSGPGGSFKATPLASSGKWTAGGSSGAFTWSYPLTIPPTPAGPAPNVTFSYSSQTVDGKTAVSSPQASWIGEGWNYDPGHIERRYRTCKDDTKTLTAGTPNNTAKTNKTSDLCWVSPNAVMSLGGSTTELVRDVPAGTNPETATESYRAAKDDGTRIERRTGAANGDNNGEYWVVTTTDGTKYYFGQNQVGAGHADTNSVSTVPVFGNHPGEPCYTTTYADSRCGTDPDDPNRDKQQAWRWGLDKVEDVHGNVMIVNWSQETNYYAVRDKRNTPEQYDRAAYPKTIEYGMRAGSLTNPPALVEFTTAQRCLKTGTACDAAQFAKTDDPGAYRPWWDTPGSLNCKSTSKLCPGFPSFWTQLRLASVTTKAARAGQSGLGKVDTYTLNHSFPEDWYDTAPSLWLHSLTRRGYAPGDTTGTLQSNDGVSFAPYTVGARSPLALRLKDKQLPNLVPTGPGDKRPAFTRPRIGVVATEAGADIEVQYKGGCDTEPTTDLGKANGTCFPVRWSPDGEEKTPAKAWFNKYVVHSVTETDKVATLFTKPITTRYSYGGAAWAKSEDEFLRPALRTYSDWRGYARVAVTKGSSTTGAIQRQSTSVTRYFQGTGGTVKDSTGTLTLLADDAPQYAGMTAEDFTFRNADDARAYLYAGQTPKALKRTLTFPESTQTASRAREAEDGTDLDRLRAFRTLVKRTDTIQADGTSWRGVRTQTLSRDSYGLPSMVESAVVTPNGTGETLSEITCTNTSFVHNTDAWLIGLLKHKRTTATTCANYATADPATEIKNSIHYSFDGGNYGDTPTKGLVTGTHELNAAGTAHAITTTNTYDPLGRIRTVTAPLTGKTETQYTPGDTGGAVTSIKTINTLGHATTTTYDPGRAQALTVTDPNGRITRTQYDALGRLTSGWSPSRATGNQTPNVKIAYQRASATPTETRPAATTVETIKDDGTYTKQVSIYDGLLRQVQTQSEAHGPGRIVSDTKYDDHGLVREQTSAYLAQGQPTPELFKVKSPTLIPSRTLTSYDGLERPVTQETLRVTKLTYITTTTYGDTSVTVNPGGTTAPTTTTHTDALGRVVKIDHHAGSGKLRTTTYGYDKRGNRDIVKDPAGNAWTYAFDARGRQTVATDPDTGTTQTTYDDADRPIISTDAQGKSLLTVYDALSRVTATHEGSLLTEPVKKYTFDRPGLLGLPYESIRHTTDQGDYVNRVTGYDTEYRPTGRETVIPTNPMTTGLSGTYTYAYTYTPTGKPLSATLPAKGGLATEKVITRYDEDGLPESTSGLAWYTSDVSYSPYGQVLRSVASAQPYRVWTTNFIDDHTGRLMRTVVDRETAGPHRVSDTGYAYDVSGTITAIARQDAVTATSSTWDNQCFTHDVLGELVNAWTSKLVPNGSGTGCKAANSTTTWGHRTDAASSSGPVADAPYSATGTPAGLDNTAPDPTTLSTDTNSYHQAFTYDWIGNRTTATDRTPAGTTTYTSTYNTPQPHTLASVASTPTGKETSYTYNPTGTTKTRNLPGTTTDQTLQWTAEQKLESNTIGTTKTTYVYDADGNRILENTPGTGSTLYLGETELTTDTVGLITRASRAYTQPGAPTIVRTTTNQSTTGHILNVLLTDHLGTAHTTVEAGGTQPVTRRAYKPYGEPRGPRPANWPNKRSYLGVGIDDTTAGLTHIGAREYDQNTGRFLSADPIIDITDPLQMNGYTYANGNPVSKSDPTGLWLDDGTGHNEPGGGPGGGQSSTPGIPAGGTGPDGCYYTCAGNAGNAGNGDDGDGDESNCFWLSTCGFSKAWESGKGWAVEHREIVSFGAEFISSGLCYGAAVSAGMVTGGAGFGAAVGCGAVGAAAGAAVNNRLTPDADHSLTGQLSDQAGGAVWGAAGGAFGFGIGKLIQKAAAKIVGKCHSFLPGTRVLMGDGTTKKIEDVKKGDVIVTTDVNTGKGHREKVTETIQTESDKEFTELTIDTSDGGSTLIATSTHPFWVPEIDSWVEAGDLASGHFLRTSAGTHVQITAVKHYTKQQRTHDLAIDDIHAYYVLAGATPVLVHNCGIQIGYNSDGLSNAAFQARVKSGIGDGRNVAVAQVEGLDKPVIGFSKGGGYHSENHILDQLAAQGIDPSRVTALYSERQPCPVCAPLLGGALNPGTPISWSVPWGADAVVNSASNDLLKLMIRAAKGG
ncbi:RHS repeat-associated core domain-containing protein [Streptomyces sp. NPDC002262]|uniref:RHS repeat-associated core domain-containing protein n=1 Tax=Streptomyces sp. NPDC002262 TaxID=3154414 RepID=UPI003325943E